MDRPEKRKQGGKGFSFPSLRGLKSPKQTDRPTEVQSPIAEPGPSSQMSSLCLCCIIEDEDIVFLVDVPVLKKEIQRERGQSTLQGVDPNMLELFKVCVSNK